MGLHSLGLEQWWDLECGVQDSAGEPVPPERDPGHAACGDTVQVGGRAVSWRCSVTSTDVEGSQQVCRHTDVMLELGWHPDLIAHLGRSTKLLFDPPPPSPPRTPCPNTQCTQCLVKWSGCSSRGLDA
jgi:hypothetical protein